MSIYINASEGICALGQNKQKILENIFAKRSALSANNVQNKEFLLGKIEQLKEIPNKNKEFNTRTNAILYNIILNLKDDLEMIFKKYKKDRIGVVIGTTTAGVEENYNEFPQTKAQLFFKRNSLGNASAFVAEFLGLKSLNFGVSSACTSGAKALIEAARLLESNLCDVAICGGVDSLNTLSIYGFDSLEILSKNNSLPFSKNREGINIGEGGALFILSKEKFKQTDVQLKGYATNNDAFHITKPSENHNAQKQAILNAFKMAKINSVEYINLHGTGTQANDKMEADLIFEICKNTPCSSTKSLMGHTLGAAGALEALICAEVVAKDSAYPLPPHFYDGIFDETLAPITLANGERAVVKNALSTSFAFGGDNSAIIVGV